MDMDCHNVEFWWQVALGDTLNWISYALIDFDILTFFNIYKGNTCYTLNGDRQARLKNDYKRTRKKKKL